MKFGCAICIFLNSENLICRSMDISKCCRGSLNFEITRVDCIRNSAFLKAQISLKCYFSAQKCLNANSCWHFKIYEQEKSHAQLS